MVDREGKERDFLGFRIVVVIIGYGRVIGKRDREKI